MSVTTIQVTTDLRDKLKSIGKKGETYNEIIERLIESSEYIDFMRENYRILDEETEWTSLDELE